MPTTEETSTAAPQINVLDMITMSQFNQLAKRFGYVPRIDVDAAWSKAAVELVATAAPKAATVGSAPPVLVAPRKPGRPKTVDAEVLPPEKPVAAKPAAPIPACGDPLPANLNGGGHTTTDARTALTSLVAAKGMGVGMKLLQIFEVKKVSDVPADRIADFIARAGEQAAQEGE